MTERERETPNTKKKYHKTLNLAKEKKKLQMQIFEYPQNKMNKKKCFAT